MRSPIREVTIGRDGEDRTIVQRLRPPLTSSAPPVDQTPKMLLVAVIAVAVWLAVIAVVVAMCVLAKAGDEALVEPRPALRLVHGAVGAAPVSSGTRSTVLH